MDRNRAPVADAHISHKLAHIHSRRYDRLMFELSSEGLGLTSSHRLLHCLFDGRSVSEVFDLDHRHAPEVVLRSSEGLGRTRCDALFGRTVGFRLGVGHLHRG